MGTQQSTECDKDDVIPELNELMAGEATLWGRAKLVIARQEREEVRTMIGEEKIRENEELLCDLQNLLTILRDYRGETKVLAEIKQSKRAAIVGMQKIQLEDQLRDMLTRVKDLNRLSQSSAPLVEHLIDGGGVGTPSCAPSTPFTGQTISPNSTLSSICFNDSLPMGFSSKNDAATKLHQKSDIYRANLSLKSIDDIQHLESIVEDLQEMLSTEANMLRDDINLVTNLIEKEIEERSRMNKEQEPSLNSLLSLRTELINAEERDAWSERLRRLPEGRKNDFVDSPEIVALKSRIGVTGGGGFAGIFAAQAHRSCGSGDGIRDLLNSPIPHPPPSLKTRHSDPIVEAEDWLSLTATLSDKDGYYNCNEAATVDLIERLPRKKGQTPADRFDIGIDDDLSD